MIKKENWNYAPRQQVKQSKKAWAVLGLTNSICKCQDQWISPKMVLGGPYKSNLCWAAATNTVHSQHLHLVECLYYIGNPKDLLGTQDVFPLLQNKPRWPLPSPHHTHPWTFSSVSGFPSAQNSDPIKPLPNIKEEQNSETAPSTDGELKDLISSQRHPLDGTHPNRGSNKQGTG